MVGHAKMQLTRQGDLIVLFAQPVVSQNSKLVLNRYSMDTQNEMTLLSSVEVRTRLLRV